MKNIHILPTDKTSRLVGSKLNLSLKDIPMSGFDAFRVYNIYITSDEEIKDCWVLNIHTNQVYFVFGYYGMQPLVKKIILTTDQDLIKEGIQTIDDEFLEWFMKNLNCEFVKVERTFVDTLTGKPIRNWSDYKIIIQKEEHDYTALLKSVGTKQETFEEALNTITKDLLPQHRITFEEGVEFGAKWQAKRMYSEEDLKKAYCDGKGIAYNILIGIREGKEMIKEWFEQFKKKQNE